ncbi:MAG: PilZ domain-containing protein [Myxococcales bacterium]|nr:PilZ domain-containing protein [Myxococcales bacterium]
MTTRNEQRREPRVAFSGLVRLRGLGEEESVEAEIRNLSVRGMFVASDKVLRLGSSVFCRVVLGDDRRVIKGKVAWIAPEKDADRRCAGIEFVDLSRKDSEVLQHALGAGGPSPPQENASPEITNLGSVEVAFEGLQNPIRARARLSEGSLIVTTKLPFLRVGSEVQVRFPPAGPGQAAPTRGRLEAVSLGDPDHDGVPRLLVELATPGPTRAEAEAPTPPVLVPRDTEPQALTLPLAAVPLLTASVQPEGVTDPDITPVAATNDEVTAVSDILIDIGSEPEATFGAPLTPGGPDEPPTEVELTPGAAVVTDAGAPAFGWATPASPPPRARYAVASAGASGLPSSIAPAVQAEGLSEPGWGASASHFQAVASTPSPAGALPWKIIAGAAVAAAALAFLTVGTDDPPSPTPPPAAALPPPPASAHTGIRIEPLPAPVVAKTVAPKAAPRPMRPPEPAAPPDDLWAPIADPSWPFTLAAESHRTTVFIPLGGRLANHRLYSVTKPDGVAGLFPEAKLRGNPGKFTVNEAGVTQVWAEAREGGLHVRVLFGTSVREHEATLEPDGLRVVGTLRQPR